MSLSNPFSMIAADFKDAKELFKRGTGYVPFAMGVTAAVFAGVSCVLTGAGIELVALYTGVHVPPMAQPAVYIAGLGLAEIGCLNFIAEQARKIEAARPNSHLRSLMRGVEQLKAE